MVICCAFSTDIVVIAIGIAEVPLIVASTIFSCMGEIASKLELEPLIAWNGYQKWKL